MALIFIKMNKNEIKYVTIKTILPSLKKIKDPLNVSNDKIFFSILKYFYTLLLV